MAENFYTILTNTGKAKIANATALGNKVNFATLKVGDSNGNYYNPTETQENLVNEVWQGNINSITTDKNNPNWIIIEVVIPSNIGGFTVREVGIFDDEGDMLAIGKYPETYKPQVADGSTKDITIRMILEVSNSASVTLKVDPTVTLATKTDFNNLAGTGRTTETVKGNADDIKNLKEDFTSHLADIGNKDGLETNDKTSIVNAINEVKSQINDSIKNNYSAVVEPTITDDSTQGYSIGSSWIFNQNLFKCIHSTEGNAIWAKIPIQKDEYGLAVDQINGDDNNIGNADKPFKTLQKAIESVPPGSLLRVVLINDYTLTQGESIYIENKLVIICGENGINKKLNIPMNIDNDNLLSSNIHLKGTSTLLFNIMTLNFTGSITKGTLSDFDYNTLRTFIRCGGDAYAGLFVITFVSCQINAINNLNLIGNGNGVNPYPHHGAVYYSTYGTTFTTATNFTKVSGIPVVTTSNTSIS